MIKFYIYYFQQLAILNKLIASTDEEEAFFFVQDPYDLDAFDTAIRSAGKTPALLLENYSADTTSAGSRNYFKQHNGRFTILHKADAGDKASIQEAQRICEQVADQLLIRMREDLLQGGKIVISQQETSPTVFFEIDKVKFDFVGPISADYYGVTVGFPFKIQFNGVYDAGAWN